MVVVKICHNKCYECQKYDKDLKTRAIPDQSLFVKDQEETVSLIYNLMT